MKIKDMTKKDWGKVGITLFILGFSGTTALLIYKAIRKKSLFPLADKEDFEFIKNTIKKPFKKKKDNENTTDSSN